MEWCDVVQVGHALAASYPYLVNWPALVEHISTAPAASPFASHAASPSHQAIPPMAASGPSPLDGMPFRSPRMHEAAHWNQSPPVAAGELSQSRTSPLRGRSRGAASRGLPPRPRATSAPPHSAGPVPRPLSSTSLRLLHSASLSRLQQQAGHAPVAAREEISTWPSTRPLDPLLQQQYLGSASAALITQPTWPTLESLRVSIRPHSIPEGGLQTRNPAGSGENSPPQSPHRDIDMTSAAGAAPSAQAARRDDQWPGLLEDIDMLDMSLLQGMSGGESHSDPRSDGQHAAARSPGHQGIGGSSASNVPSMGRRSPALGGPSAQLRSGGGSNEVPAAQRPTRSAERGLDEIADEIGVPAGDVEGGGYVMNAGECRPS